MQNNTMDRLVSEKIKCFRVELLTRISPDVLVDEMTCLSRSAKEEIKAKQETKGTRLAAGLFLDQIVRFNGFGEQFLSALRNNKLGDLADKLSGKDQKKSESNQPPHSHMGPGEGDMPPTIPVHLPRVDSPPPYSFEGSQLDDYSSSSNSSIKKPFDLGDRNQPSIPIYEQDQREKLSKYSIPTEPELIPINSASNSCNQEPNDNQSNLNLNQSMNVPGSNLNESSVSYNIPPSSHDNFASLAKNASVMPDNSLSNMEETVKCRPNIDAILNDSSARSEDLHALPEESRHESIYNSSDLEFSESKPLPSGKVMMSDETLPSSSCFSSVDKTLPTDSPAKGQSDSEISCENDEEEDNSNDTGSEIESSQSLVVNNELNQEQLNIQPNQPEENNRGVLTTILQSIWLFVTLEDGN